MVIMDTTYTNVVDASTSQIASDTKFHVAGPVSYTHLTLPTKA